MKIPTPISDHIVSQFRKGEAHSDGLILTMVDLELKLIAALAEIDRLDVSGIHSCHSECQKSNCVLRRELAAATEQRDVAQEHREKLLEILQNVITEQWDRLIKTIEPLKYWRDISECDCSNPLPQGGCLRCDLERILKLTNPNEL